MTVTLQKQKQEAHTLNGAFPYMMRQQLKEAWGLPNGACWKEERTAPKAPLERAFGTFSFCSTKRDLEYPQLASTNLAPTVLFLEEGCFSVFHIYPEGSDAVYSQLPCGTIVGNHRRESHG